MNQIPSAWHRSWPSVLEVFFGFSFESFLQVPCWLLPGRGLCHRQPFEHPEGHGKTTSDQLKLQSKQTTHPNVVSQGLSFLPENVQFVHLAYLIIMAVSTVLLVCRDT